MDKLIGKVVDKVAGNDDDYDRTQGLQQGGGNLTHGGAYPAGGGHPYPGDNDLHGAASVASKEAQEDQGFFALAISKLLDSKKNQPDDDDDDIDEEEVVGSHRKYFGFGGGDDSSTTATSTAQPASTSSLGSAAAVEALKLFTSSSSSSSSSTAADASTPSQSQNAFVGLAMAQAAKLFDAQAAEGKVEPGADKQSAVIKAGELALKMYLKSHGVGGAQQEGGGGGGGAAAGLLNLAGKFLK
ncbi:hypothetical protein VTH82DRAFT_3889 [Thermothelomyces myriococcoides]